jgi:hypothetical protein
VNLDERDRVTDLFGGTALARTHFPNGRLSEDIDLIALDPRRGTLAADLDAALPRALQRAYGRLEWAPPLSAGSSVDAATLHTTSGLAVKIQLLASTDRTLWPTEPRTLIQRYSDAPPARLLVPTLPAFAASKTATWCDRAAARDLWDLWALANIGAINPHTAALFRKHGPTGKNPGTYVFTPRPATTNGTRNSPAKPDSPSPPPTPSTPSAPHGTTSHPTPDHLPHPTRTGDASPMHQNQIHRISDRPHTLGCDGFAPRTEMTPCLDAVWCG